MDHEVFGRRGQLEHAAKVEHAERIAQGVRVRNPGCRERSPKDPGGANCAALQRGPTTNVKMPRAIEALDARRSALMFSSTGPRPDSTEPIGLPR